MKYKSTKNSYFLDTRSQFFFIFLVRISFCMIIIEITKKQARGARSLGKFLKYRNKKKSEKQIFTPKECEILSTENNFEPI